MEEVQRDMPAYFQRLAKKLEPSADVVKKTLQNHERIMHILYIKSVVDMMQLQEIIIKPFYEQPKETNFAQYIRSLPYEMLVWNKD